MVILQAQNISVSYQEKRVLDNLTMSIRRASIVSIIGPNGSGKSTLLKVLSRNLKPQRGKVLLHGDNIFSLGTKKVARQMSVLTQHHQCPPDLLVRELVAYGRFAHREWWQGGSRADDDLVEWAMERTRVKAFSGQKVGALSGGEMQRVWLAMTIAQKPEILLLDEPTTYLDICHQLELLELVYELNRSEGITVIMVLHDINQAARYSDELMVIKEGGVYAEGRPDQVIHPGLLREVFQVEASVDLDQTLGCPVCYPRSVCTG